MRVLIAVASKHGGTYGIATRLRSHLLDKGHDAAVLKIDGSSRPDTDTYDTDGTDTHDTDTDAYDAYVVGAAVYGGRWMKPARQFVHDHLIVLRSKPLWMFSSGPLGEHADPGAAVDHPEDIGTLAGAREHKVFAGRLFRKELGPLERVAAAAVHAPEGDFRDWSEIDQWADHIDEQLRELAHA